MGDLYSAEILGYGYDGEGVARLNGKVVFLPYSLKGEKIKFEKLEEKSRYIKGRIVDVSNENSNRRIAPCPYFKRCGGCTLQHTCYEYELQIKKELLCSQLKKVGYYGEMKVFGSPKDYEYRNKIRLFVGERGLALKERGSNRLVYIDKCLLVLPKINDAIFKINNFIKLQGLEKTYREVVIRQEGDNLLINFIVKKQEKINYQGLYLLLDGDCGIFETVNGELVHQVGISTLEVNEMGLNCKFSVNSFHQVNSYLTEKLYEGIIENIFRDRVINCYSGAGVLSGVIAKQGKKVIGIELGESEHQDAEKLKIDNILSNLINICGDCADVLAKFNKETDTIIVDPPRAGLEDKVCQTLNSIICNRLIYVSCNSATLVRDIERLKSYNIEKIALYDMFSRTGEYEVLCVMSKNQ